MFRFLSTFLNTNVFLGFIPGLILLTSVAAQAEDLTRDFVAGMPENFPPHFFIDTKSEKPVGFGVDVMDAVAKKSGINIRYEIFENWKETIQAAKDGRIDIIPNIGFTEERKSFAEYTTPYETFRINFYIRASSLSLQSVADIENSEIGVVSTNKARFLLEKKGKYTLVTTDSSEELAWKLIAGDVDCIAMPEPVMSYLVQKAGLADQIKVLGSPIVEIKRGIGVSKGNSDLVQLLSSTLDDFVLSQEFKDIYTKWYGAPKPYWTSTRIGSVGAALLLFVFFSIALWRYRFITKVNKELEITIHERTKKIVESEATVRRKLKAITDPDGDLGDLELFDLIDADTIQQLLDEMYAITGMCIGLADLKGNILASAGWRDICYKFHRVHPETSKNCTESDTLLSSGIAQGEFKMYHCKNNMWETASPIVIAGEHLGNVFFGQFFFDDEELDVELFRNQAQKFGFDEKEYLAALENVPRYSRETAEHTIRFYIKLASIISSQSYSNLKLSREIFEREKAEEELRESEKRLREAQSMAHFGHWNFDPTTGSTVWSEEMYNILGCDPADGSPSFSKHPEFIHPDDWEWFETTVRDAAEHGTPYDIILRIVHPDGSLHFINSICTPITDDTGAVIELRGTIQDITERMQAEAKLQLVNNALEDSLNAFYIVSAGGIFTYVNKAYVEMWGYDSDEEIIGTTLVEHCLDPKQPARIIDTLETTGKFEGEFTAKRKDGSSFEVLMSARLAHDPDGNVIYPTSSLDITELMRARNELRKEKDQLQFALDVVEMGAWDLNLIDHSSHRTFRHDQIFGYNSPLKEWTYEMFLDHVLPEDREEVNRKFSEATANQSNWDFECRIRRPDGEIRWISAVGRHGEPEDGIVRVMGGTVLDITERKQAEESLNQQQRSIELWSQITNVFLTATQEEVFAEVLTILLKTLESRFGFLGYIDENGDMVCPALTRDVWDQYQAAEKSIVFHKSRWGDFWGRSLIELRTVITNENLEIPEGNVALENAMATPIVYNDTLIGQFALGNKAEPYNKDDQNLLENVAAQTAPILFAILEETRQKAAHQDLENQMRQAQKMEAVGRLAGGVAHDYNNMLSVIIGYSENALESLSKEDPLYDDLTEILSAGKRSADITRQLLAFARQQTTAPIVLDLNECIEGMLKMLRRLIGENIDLAWLPDSNLSMIKIDPAQVDQVLANLCVNARDAISDVGKITIETKSIHISEEYVRNHPDSIAGDFVILAVSDDGSGMSAETAEKIFEPFFTTKGRFEGTGLGLATVHGIVKQNQGFINVYSETGEGTTIKCYLPLQAEESGKEHPAEQGNPTLGGGEAILMVEDDKSILKLGVKILTKLGYTVIPISDPSEAAQIAPDKLAGIDLLITDVVMPNMNGRELSTHLHSINPRLKTLYMSGYTANVIAHRGVLDEGIHFIQKPLSKTELSLKVREVLEKVDT